MLLALYLCVFLAVFGLASLAGLSFRGWLLGTGVRHEYVRASNRQAVLFGLMAVIVLMLQAGKIFNLWSAALLLVIFILLDMYIQ